MFYLILVNSTGEFIGLAPELDKAHEVADEVLNQYIGKKEDIVIYEIDPVTLKQTFICSVSN